MPSPEYRNSGNGQEYGNKQGSPQLDMDIIAIDDNDVEVTAAMWIKAARNEGLSVHVPSSNTLVTSIRDQSREFSAYIPGLSGIPLSEEKRSRLIVHRLAAAGDANTVLRNVLLLLKDSTVEHENGLLQVQRFVSRVMGEVTLEVEFREDKHSTIQARFQTAEMRQADPRRFKPLELAGIGFLQVIQIFAYLVYFRPVILLVDEPDSHLHPTAQERLVKVLADAARHFTTQVLLTTHSPSVIRALPPAARVIWMRGGKVQENGDTEGRRLMGWGLLDRRVLLMTEDKDAGMLQSLIAQWPDLDRQIAVWPFAGSATLPKPEIISGLVNLTGGSLKAMLHRDRDFLMPDEVDFLSQQYANAGHTLWFTQFSDMDAYWAEPRVISAHFGVEITKAQLFLDTAIEEICANDAALKQRRNKRKEAVNKISEKAGLPHYSDAEVETEASQYGNQYKILGKDLVAAIRKSAQDKGLKQVASFGSIVPSQLSPTMALDLKDALQAVIK